MASELASVRDQRNITFELCAWGFGNVETFGGGMGHLWRTSQDITDTWHGLLWNIDVNDEVRHLKTSSFLSDQDHFQERYRQEGVQGPENGWNYPDGLFVGKVTIIMTIKILTIIFIMVTVFAQGGMTDIEYKSMFALWCLVKAPLMLGADLRTITRYDDNEMTI